MNENLRIDAEFLRATAYGLLQECLDQPHGLTVEVEALGPMPAPALRAKQILYRFKAENADFADIQILLSPDNPNNELWLLKNGIPKRDPEFQKPQDPEPEPIEIEI